MPYMDNSSYREISFSAETPYRDFYTYVDLKDVPDKCENQIDEIVRCRTIGVLQSLNGRYYIRDLNSSGMDSTPLVQVSVVYMSSPPASTVVPYPVQIFGTLQWHNRPVIFAKILQILCVSTAIRLRNTLTSITTALLAKRTHNENEAT